MDSAQGGANVLPSAELAVALIAVPTPTHDIIQRWAVAAGYRVESYETGTKALVELRAGAALVIVNDTLRDMNGVACCNAIRRLFGAPVLFLTSREDDRAGDEARLAGAGRVLGHSEDAFQLIINACELLREGKASEPPLAPDPGVRLDMDRFSAHTARGRLPLTRAQFDLLNSLVTARGRVLDFSEIAKVLRVDCQNDYAGRIRVHVHKLRSALGQESRRLKTVRGRGYAWE